MIASPEGIGSSSLRRRRQSMFAAFSNWFTAGQSVIPIYRGTFLIIVKRRLEEPDLHTKEEWISVLEYARLFQIESFRRFCVEKLAPITSAVDKIVYGRAFDIAEWMSDAYRDICEQPDWPVDDDCRRLGLEAVMNIARARQAIRTSTELKSSRDERNAIMKAIFKL
jgi:hypothetical protein